MELDADLFRRIVGDAALPLPPEAPDDRRATGRVFLGRRTHLIPVSDPASKPVGVVIRDVSLLGVGILTTTPLPAGEMFRLVLPLVEALPNGGSSVTLECRTLWRKAGDYGDGSSFIVGAEFVQMIP
jgi:hypothetical protein